MQIFYENRHIGCEVFSKAISSNSKLHKYFKSSFGNVTPNNYCGFISANNKNYFIAPKIAKSEDENFNIFIYMLIYAYDINISNQDLSTLSSQKHKLLEVFIKYFANTLLSELKRGVYKSYTTKEENLKVLKGKYVVIKNFSNFYHQNIYCEYDDFTQDNSLNRLFLYAIREFKKISKEKNLYLIESILDETTYTHIDINYLNIEFNRLNSRFKKSYKIAIFLLKHLIAMPSASKNQGVSFMFNMAEVFEKFIGKLFQEIEPNAELQQIGFFGNLKLNPDIFTNKLIIDTKYKLINTKKDLKPMDKYQMFAYGINFKVKETMLLYPKHIKNISLDLKLGSDENLINLKLRSIDLNFDGEYNEFINEVKKRLKETIE